MKYPTISRGKMEAAVNRLGGATGLKRFLRGETVVVTPDRLWESWISLEIGDESPEGLRVGLRDSGCEIDRSAEKTLRNLTVSTKRMVLDLVIVTADQLKLRERCKFVNGIALFKAALGEGLRYCPLEIGPKLLIHNIVGKGEVYYVASKPNPDGYLQISYTGDQYREEPAKIFSLLPANMNSVGIGGWEKWIFVRPKPKNRPELFAD